jgi:hypothetical protein
MDYDFAQGLGCAQAPSYVRQGCAANNAMIFGSLNKQTRD